MDKSFRNLTVPKREVVEGPRAHTIWFKAGAGITHNGVRIWRGFLDVITDIAGTSVGAASAAQP
jgi:hypothetical protein